MPHFMDINNPNRDLSDPNWISSGAYHHEMSKKTSKSNSNNETSNNEKIPKEVKVMFFDGVENFELIEIFDKDLRCESCNQLGSYYIQDEIEKLGLCMYHLKMQYGKVMISND